MADTRTKLVSATSTGVPFRYYIHDGITEFRLQLIGLLQESRVPELVGCWTTAKSILSSRTLVLDVTALKAADEAGREWLLSMVREGATTLPDDYFRVHLRSDADFSASECVERGGLLSRVTSLFRGKGELPVGSSSRAR